MIVGIKSYLVEWAKGRRHMYHAKVCLCTVWTRCWSPRIIFASFELQQTLCAYGFVATTGVINKSRIVLVEMLQVSLGTGLISILPLTSKHMGHSVTCVDKSQERFEHAIDGSGFSVQPARTKKINIPLLSWYILLRYRYLRRMEPIDLREWIFAQVWGCSLMRRKDLGGTTIRDQCGQRRWWTWNVGFPCPVGGWLRATRQVRLILSAAVKKKDVN